MENKTRENGYYWITAWGERIICMWDTCYWLYAGSDMTIPENVIRDINEKRITEDENNN